MMPVTHIVMFNAIVEPTAIAEVHAALHKARSEGDIAFDSLALGTGLSRAVRDGVFGGAICTGSLLSGTRLLIVTFADRDSLDRYYEAPVHSAIRRDFLCRTSPALAALYARADGSPPDWHVIYEEIEAKAMMLMQRIDFESG